jgi:hypothetical protein
MHLASYVPEPVYSYLHFDDRCDKFYGFWQGWRSSVGRASDL